MKEMLIEILGVAEEKQDFKSAFMILLCTQKISLEAAKDSETIHLAEFYYALALTRNRAFWSAAISHYRTVVFDNKIIDPTGTLDEEQAYIKIIEANVYSMLYCVRSREICVDICKLFVRNSSRFEEIKLKLLKIDRISKVQIKKELFNELDSSLSNSTN